MGDLKTGDSLAWLRPKLAELCGLKAQGRYYIRGDTVPLYAIDFKKYGSDEVWRPDEDVAQAVRCLEAMGCDCGLVRRTEVVGIGPIWDCWIQPKNANQVFHAHDTAPGAACLAIASALGWSEGDGREGK